MKRPRTLFGPFVLIAMLCIGVGLWRMDETQAKGSGRLAEIKDEKSEATLARTLVQRILRSRLIVPVRGLTRADLHDTWGDARSEGRRHEGIDIMAPQGAPVLAVADGVIAKFFESERGGITIYQFDQSGRFVYYYAHLHARAAGLAEGDAVRQGDVIAYVGMTGNAPVPHLHFEIQRLTGERRRWWEADSMNPYNYLMTGRPPV